MTWVPEDWSRLEPHLDALLDLPEDARTGYLDSLPPGDRDLRTDLEALLALSADDSILSAPPSPQLLEAVVQEAPRSDSLIGGTLGRYRLVERIGSGGMGVVYRAERADQAYSQDVAVKVLQRAAGDDMARRFHRERETLALLDHPNVTRILDGGVSEDGVSYLVMELVRGSTITAYSRNRNLTVRDRVRIFLGVCGAVHAAHQRLIVHRDLKPSNVVVTDDGTVKVLDFGIAKWLDEESTLGGPILTRTGDRYLTPQYASPEQFRGDPITTASDVFSLGLLLYELLSGKLPYDLEGKPPTEQERLICEEAPPSPASVTSGPGARAIRGDLEQIVLKSLRKEPERRYTSVEALADDLRAWLDGRSVSATPDSRTYRLRRFVARHRAAVTSGVVVTLALISGLGISVRMAGVASRERDRARVETRHSEEVVHFLIDAIRKASPFVSPQEVTVAQLLDASATRINTAFHNQPEVQLALLTTIGEAYSQMDRLTESLVLFDRAAGLADSIHGPESLPMANILHQKARVLGTLGNPDSARVLLARAEAILRPRTDREARLQLSDVLEDRGAQSTKLDSALAFQREALGIREALYDGPHENLAHSYHYIAATLSELNDPSAPEWFARAAAMLRMTVGDLDANLARTLNNWAIWYHRHGEPDSAAALYRQTLEMQEKIHGESSPSLAGTLTNLGNFYVEIERYDQARTMLDRALAILVPNRGDVLETGAAYANLGHVEFFLQNYAASERAYLEARRIFVKVFGPDHMYPGVMDTYLGRLYWKGGREEEARSRFTAGLGKLEAARPAAARREGPARVWYGQFLLEAGDLAGAERALRKGLELTTDQYGADQWEPAEARAALGICLVRQGNREEGLPLLRAGHLALDRIRGPEHPMAVWAAGALAESGTQPSIQRDTDK